MKVGNISMVDCTHTFLVSIRSCSQSDFNLKKKKNVTRVTERTLTSIKETDCSTFDKETETFKGNTRIHVHLIGKLHEEVSKW